MLWTGRWFAALALNAILLWNFSNAQAQKPSVQAPNESVLPGDVKPNPVQVVDEKVLPGQRGPQNSGNLAVPDERVLANAAKEANAVQGSDERPWLRLTFPGHTGRIQAVDMNPSGTWMVSAGEDKDIHVWQRQSEPGAAWFHRRTVRWEIERGDRGRIQTVALRETLAAFAGLGARSGNGAIWIVDIATGAHVATLNDLAQGHRQPVVSLSWAPGNALRLASADMDGRVLVWEPDSATGLWQSQVIDASDQERYGAELASQLMQYRSSLPIHFINEHELLLPQLAEGKSEQGEFRWHLKRVHTKNNTTQVLDQIFHEGLVYQLSVGNEGRSFLSMDDFGKTYAWHEIENAIQVVEVPLENAFPSALFVEPKSTRCFIATNGQQDLAPQLQQWDLSTLPEPPKKLRSASLPSAPLRCLSDAAHLEVVLAQYNQLFVFPWTENAPERLQVKQALAPKVKPVLRVAFSKESEPYKVAFGTGTDANGNPLLQNVFDFSVMKLGRDAAMDPAQWIESKETFDPWRIAPDTVDGVDGHWFFRGDARGARLPLEAIMHGNPTSLDWIQKIAKAEPAEAVPLQGNRTLVAVVGSNGRNNIYLFEPSMEGASRVVRQFRGHNGAVLSTSASADGRYLVSGAEDATLCIWKLEDVFTASEMVNRWGLELEVQEGKLVATQVREDGPLYFRGVREGDQLVNIEWDDRTDQDHAETQAEAIINALKTVEFDTQVIFHWSRRGRPLSFTSYPAWYPVATLFVDADREWACWTPAGYYTASINGHQRFGWQINKGEQTLPLFFRADQFREKLERPVMMQRLLKTGSLTQAMLQSGPGVGPPPEEQAIWNQIRTKPAIEVIAPQENAVVDQNVLVVKAKIRVPLGAELLPPKVFASGVPAIERKLIRETSNELGHEFEYHWNVRLPSDRNLSIDLIAATDAKVVERATVRVQNRSPLSKTRPQLFILTAGVNQYRDSQIPGLEFATENANQVRKSFLAGSQSLYSIRGESLLNEFAVRSLWKSYATAAVEELRHRVTPNDLVVLYFSGHGIRDRRTNQWYYVTSDARYLDIMNDRYDDCVGIDDLSAFIELPCRKLAILDTCHSGAIQPALDPSDLRAVLRWLQDDLIITLTASEGDEEAVEQRERRLGRFTGYLVDALQGTADMEGGDRNGVVTLQEVIRYVRSGVEQESATSGFSQHPTAGPADLLEWIDVPLTASGTATEFPLRP